MNTKGSKASLYNVGASPQMEGAWPMQLLAVTPGIVFCDNTAVSGTYSVSRKISI